MTGTCPSVSAVLVNAAGPSGFPRPGSVSPPARGRGGRSEEKRGLGKKRCPRGAGEPQDGLENPRMGSGCPQGCETLPVPPVSPAPTHTFEYTTQTRVGRGSGEGRGRPGRAGAHPRRAPGCPQGCAALPARPVSPVHTHYFAYVAQGASLFAFTVFHLVRRGNDDFFHHNYVLLLPFTVFNAEGSENRIRECHLAWESHHHHHHHWRGPVSHRGGKEPPWSLQCPTGEG